MAKKILGVGIGIAVIIVIIIGLGYSGFENNNIDSESNNDSIGNSQEDTREPITYSLELSESMGVSTP